MENKGIKSVNRIGKFGLVLCRIWGITLAVGLLLGAFTGVLPLLASGDETYLELASENTATISPSVNECLYMTSISSISGNIIVDKYDGIASFLGHSYRIQNEEGGEPIVEKTIITVGNLKLMILLTLASYAAMLYAVTRGDKLFLLLRDCETPFSQEIANALSRLAWGIVPAYIVYGLAYGYSNYIKVGTFVPNYNLSHVVLILCLFALAQVFKYGAALQTQSDETL